MRSRRSRIGLGVLATVSMLMVSCGSDDDGGAVDDSAADATSPGGVATTPAGEAPADAEPVTLSILHASTPADIQLIGVMTAKYTELHPNVTFETETHPGGEEGDNLVKTKLATGEMNDIFYYNSGSLLQALSPDRSIEPLTGDPALETVSEGFLPAVTFGDEVYGVPAGPGFAGGILYNKDVFADLGIEVPKTWAEFEANNEKIKAAGIPPVLATYADAWTAQLFVLADYFNVAAQDPEFTEQYTNNKAKYASTPAALTGFERLAEGAEKGWYQPDYLSTTHADGLGMLARGEVAQYPMLSVVVPAIEADTPGSGEKIGFFAQPSDSADINGATLWLPNAMYIAKNSEHKDAAKEFLRWVTSIEGAEYVMSKIPPTGPIVLDGVTLPDTVLPAVKDVQAYVDSGNASPALEFLSPVKGPGLPQISVEVGSGIRGAADGAKTYDDDVEKQAKQLGLEGW
jgi:raffinose/stachyose/melibiose transport system substrate-binding protein